MTINISLNGKSLAAGALLFSAVVLALASTVARGTDAAPSNASAIVQDMIDEKDHVTAGELATWLTERRTDFQLIDIRLPWQFDDYHIPTAINIPLAELFQPKGLAQLARAKKVVVYGLGAGHAAEAQLLLSMKGYNSLSVKEGISAWWDDVLTPLSLRSDSPSPTGYRQAKQMRERFLGSPGAKPSSATPTTEVVPPAPTSTTPGAGRKLKLGRGCS